MRARALLPGAPLVLAIACATAPATTTSGLAARSAHAPLPPIPAFVVVLRDATLVVPVAPEEPVVRADGWWRLDSESDPPRALRAMVTDPGASLPECRCSLAIGACGPSAGVQAVPTTGPIPSALEACTCAVPAGDGTSDCDATPDELDVADPCLHPCDATEGFWADAEPVSYVGGVVYAAGEAHEGDPDCGGLNLYSANAESWDLRREGASDFSWSAPELEVAGAVVSSCDPDAGELGPPWDRANGGCRLDQGTWRLFDAAEQAFVEPDPNDDFDPCDACDDGPSAEVVGLRAGLLWARRWSFFAPTVVLADRATPEACPGAHDPCGDPAAFSILRAAVNPDDPLGLDFWVASDDSAALVGPFGEVWLPDAEAPVREVGADADLGDALGVEFYADARTLLEAMRHAEDEAARSDGAIAELAPLASCGTDADCDANQRCSAEVCHAPCASDEDCATLGACGSFCSAGGRCLYLRDRRCDANHACDPGFDCGADEACTPHDAALAAEDRDFVDRRHGRDWGNRCYRHVEAGEHEAAEAACEEGLELAEDDALRGALLFNLGLAAEGRGWTARAVEYHTESLALRENATVRQHLEALTLEESGEGEE